jgi:hypothetical protein
MRRFLIPALLVFLCASQATAQETYRRTPWHLVDLWWTLAPEAAVENLRELSVAVEIEKDPGQSVPIYIAPIGLVRLDGIAAYAGLQTDMNRPGRGAVGRGIIFSRWGERRESFIRTAPEGYHESSGHEGDFIGVRRPLTWGLGTYETKLQVSNTTGPDGAGWVRYEVCLIRTNCTAGGELGFARPPEKLGRQIASFVEIYGKPIDPDRIPQFSVVFHPPKLNGKPARLSNVTANYPANVPFVARALARADGAIQVIIGPKRNPAELPVSSNGKFRSETLPLPRAN